MVACAGRSQSIDPEELIGSWESEQRSLDRPSILEIHDDLTGEARFSTGVQGHEGVFYSLYEFVAIDTDAGNAVAFDMDAGDGYEHQDFRMSCEVVTIDLLECTRGGIYEGRPVTWLRTDD